MKTIGSETLITRVINCIYQGCCQKIIRVVIFYRNRYYPLYFDYTTKVRIYHCPRCGAHLYQKNETNLPSFLRLSKNLPEPANTPSLLKQSLLM